MDIKSKIADILTDFIHKQSKEYRIVENQILEIIRECCEEQKKECSESALISKEDINITRENEGVPFCVEKDIYFREEDIIYEVYKESILNCKNVCG